MGQGSGGGPANLHQVAALPTPGELPATLREYLDVSCADLLDELTAAQRASVISTVHCSYAGGPWPPRLEVQRLAEIAAGVITGDACVGELVARSGHPVDDVIELLHSDDLDVRDKRDRDAGTLSQH